MAGDCLGPTLVRAKCRDLGRACGKTLKPAAHRCRIYDRPSYGASAAPFSRAASSNATSHAAPGNRRQDLAFRWTNKRWSPANDLPDRRAPLMKSRIIFRGDTPLADPDSHRDDPPPLAVQDGVLVLTSRHESIPVPGRWVRDVCACPECRHQDTAQRQVNVFRSDASKFKIATADVSEWPRHVKVTFEDGHETIVPAFVVRNRRSHLGARKREGIVGVTTWTSDIDRNPPTVPYADIQAGPGMATLLHKIRTHGFAFVDCMPATPEATQALLESIGPIRNTHYGAFYDFTSDLSSKDTAYTTEALEPHTDTTYFTDPAGLQALHLLSHTDGAGGESILVDGFGAAEQLFKLHPASYARLSSTGVYAHASGNEGISIQPAQAFPTFTHSEQVNKLIQVRWNNADRTGVATPWRHLERWYDAAARFDAILNEPRNQYWFQLKPGRMLLFDNWRVLHGRAAFTGKRRMCGGYINRDDFISRFRTTNYGGEEMEGSTVTGWGLVAAFGEVECGVFPAQEVVGHEHREALEARE